MPITRKIAAVWPDRFFFSDETDVGGPLKLSFGIRQKSLSIRRNGEPFEHWGHERCERVYIDSIGQHWLPMLVPLTDPKTVVFAPRSKLPVAILGYGPGFSPGLPAVHALVQREDRLARSRDLLAHGRASRGEQGLLDLGTQAGGGRATADEVRVRAERNAGRTVDGTEWEFPEKIEDAVFDQTAK